MENKMITARVELDEYANKVFAVLKAKYGLNDKSEAINKLVELYGEDIVEKEANDEYIQDMIKGVNEHIKRYGHKKMSFEELDALCEV